MLKVSYIIGHNNQVMMQSETGNKKIKVTNAEALFL